MKIAIDLNDVVRDYSDNFIKFYLTDYNREFDTTDFELWSNNMQHVLPFKTDRAYHNFTYIDFAYELFGKCAVCNKNIPKELKSWCDALKDIEVDEPVELMFVSPMEYGEAMNYSYFFISKLGCEIREVYFPVDSLTIWNKCDVLITANPLLIENKPEDKICVKIKAQYNKNCNCEYEYSDFVQFMKDNNFIETIIKNEGKEE